MVKSEKGGVGVGYEGESYTWQVHKSKKNLEKSLVLYAILF